METSSGSVVFDRAAEFYDATRSLSQEASAAVTELLASEVQGKGRVLEIGVGTGRIALPLVERGIEIVGIDLSVPMLRKLLEKAGSSSVPVVVSDATRLPFTDHSFGAAIACHVLHLIRDWTQAVDELVRVSETAGTILVDQGGWRQGFLQDLEKRFAESAGIDRAWVGLQKVEDLDSAMAARGAGVRVLPKISDKRAIAPGSIIDSFEQGIFSFTWGLEPEERQRAAAATREWAVQEFGSLNEPRTVELSTGWRAYELPG